MRMSCRRSGIAAGEIRAQEIIIASAEKRMTVAPGMNCHRGSGIKERTHLYNMSFSGIAHNEREQYVTKRISAYFGEIWRQHHACRKILIAQYAKHDKKKLHIGEENLSIS